MINFKKEIKMLMILLWMQNQKIPRKIKKVLFIKEKENNFKMIKLIMIIKNNH